MRLRHALGWLLLAAFVSLSVTSYSMDEASAREIAKAFLKKVDGAVSDSSLARMAFARSTSGVRFTVEKFVWQADDDQRSLVIDDALHEVILFIRNDLFDSIRRRDFVKKTHTKHHFANDDDLITEARNKLESVGWTHGSDGVIANPAAVSGDRREILYVKFFDHPNRFGTGQTGNMALVGLDSFTGDIVEVQRFSGFRYAAPKVLITSKDALTRAAEHFGVGADALLTSPAQYQQIPETFRLTERGRKLSESKTLIVCYLVHGPKMVAIVAADNGEVLASMNEGTAVDREAPEPLSLGSAPQGKEDSPKSGEGRSLMAGVLGVGILIAGGTSVLAKVLLRRGRESL